MKKTISQGVILLLIFCSVWFSVSQINWLNLFGASEKRDALEEKLGDFYWEYFSKDETEVTDSVAINIIDTLLTQICISNDIDKSSIKLHLLDNETVNAFALPDGHLVIYSGLIRETENEGELVGVICHELAHIELNHVMKTLGKEVGLSVLLAITTGNGNGAAITEVARVLSSSAYDRKMEKTADLTAADYMINTGVDPEDFANFLYKLGESEPDSYAYLTWISTHPETFERAEYIANQSKLLISEPRKILAEGSWGTLLEKLEYE